MLSDLLVIEFTIFIKDLKDNRTWGQDTVLSIRVFIFTHLFLAMAMIEQAHHCSFGLTDTFEGHSQGQVRLACNDVNIL